MTTTMTDPWPVAFYGRTARAQDPEHTNDHLARQYLACAASLPTGLIVAVYYDIGPTNWLHPHPPEVITVEGTTLRRDGGLRELLAEAGDPASCRFDYLVTAGLDRLHRSHNECLALVTHLHQLGVHTLVPGEPPHGQIIHALHVTAAVLASPPRTSETPTTEGPHGATAHPPPDQSSRRAAHRHRRRPAPPSPHPDR